MRLITSPNLSKLRRPIAAFDQRTFHTPLNDLPRFVDLLLAGKPEIATASVTVEQVVFTPEHLKKLLAGHQLPLQYHDRAIVAEGHQQSADLLVAALSDSLDFYFVPEPKRFILYADHDEFTTLFAARKGMLSAIVDSLIGAGFQEESEYLREL
jgi:hypothetical protein